MKRIFLVVALIIGLISCTNNKQQSAHNHDHSTHQHSESCSHNHDHSGHNHNHNHDHQHSASCNHDHNHDHSTHNHDHSGHNHDHSSHNHDHSGHNHDAHNHGDDAITFSVEQQNKINFEVVEVVTEPLYQIIRTSAQVVPSQEGEKILTATTSGIVNFENKDIYFSLSSAFSGLFMYSIIRFEELK